MEKVGRPREIRTSSALCDGLMRRKEAIRPWKLDRKKRVGAGTDKKILPFSGKPDDYDLSNRSRRLLEGCSWRYHLKRKTNPRREGRSKARAGN